MAKVISITPDQPANQPEQWILEKLRANDERRWQEVKKKHMAKFKALRSKKAS